MKLLIIIIGTILLLFVGYGYISPESFSSNLINFFDWTLINFFISLVIGWIILPFDKLFYFITGYSLKDINIIEENLECPFSLRVTISWFIVIEFILGFIFF